MDEDSPETRRSLKFWLWAVLAAVNVFTLFFLIVMMRPATIFRPRTKPLMTYQPADPGVIKPLVAQINGPKRKVGYIKNIQVPAAVRLKIVGPPAKDYGAVEALTELMATTDDPETKEAAEAALKSIEGI